ncbi:MAG: hypothetical protein RMJ15_00130 [Nitrososphaerota archaeon]|nr:hypothetical protein [Candidatus Bathyarchaeota archaeon]MDW8022143.1 hypothetical protein [Nitrososphaerota archaeon]
MLKTEKIERAELYKDSKVQAFLSKILSEEIKELKPAFDPSSGYRYPMVEAVLGETPPVESFLTRLYEAGILERKLYDRVIFCPSCNSQNVSTHYCCPYCKSFNIQRGSLIEHVKCGYIGLEENFRKGGMLVCPKCKKELKKPDAEYRKAGIWCTCKDCGKSFDVPVTRHFCRNCHADFTFEELEMKDVYAYSLNEKVKGEISLGWIFVPPIREFLLRNGFEVEAPAFLKGRSGANHMFDLAVYQKEKKGVTVIDLAASTEDVVSEQPVIALFAKIYDVSPESALLVAIPKLSENGNRMAQLYNIKVVEGKDAKEITQALKEKWLNKPA